ncbi:alkaline phosphatase [Nitrincola sp. A-D6]|uniref:DeoR/GlpR family DNA-binding transcription regulator n=1 Tax=Nitrincola sp. A-D6 TaxID=1545442 RepID=UPI00051FED2D|nr:DeoR/GlpR family DNA-binding transcription regulator [Nitrincola sp. A-D6]KGK41537.1 alkaline phosphatase [Nitrincola sp. A-D6]
MWHEERHLRIRTLLATFGRISVDRIVTEMQVSRETARRDLMDMEAAGELRRVRGGAVAITDAVEPPFAERAQIRLKEKRLIARTAAALVSGGQTLFLDAGSTTTLLAEALSALSGLTLITNSIEAAQKLREADGMENRENRIVLLGGELSRELPATFGAGTINELSRYHVDVAMLSPYGIDAEQGAGSFDLQEAEIARAMVGHAHQVMILADYSKIGTVSRVAYCPPELIDHLIVDAKAVSQQGWEELSQRVKRVTVAPRR